jgi:hypothetical protein
MKPDPGPDLSIGFTPTYTNRYLFTISATQPRPRRLL